jgi:hypothetical protein
MTVPGGFAGVSFHQRCVKGDPKAAQAKQIARDLTQPTPRVMH